jgi:hypothetical protein
MLARLLDKFAAWALARNAARHGGGFRKPDDPRWAFTIGIGDSPYLTRVMLPWRVLGIQPYLHHMHRADADRDLHNHPFAWAFSIVLCGSYDERRLVDDAEDCRNLYAASTGVAPNEVGLEHFVVHRRIRWFNLLTRDDYHKIERLHGEVWTLFVTGPRVQDWGFLVRGKHVPHSEYEYIGKATS